MQVVSYKDNGIAIPESEAKDLFKVFYRTDQSRSQAIAGSGLGLAIVQGIVSAHRGSVSVNHDYTDSLEIMITLPIGKNKEGGTGEADTHH